MQKVKSSENNVISLPVFYLIMRLMKSPKNFEEIAILEIWELVFLVGFKLKTYLLYHEKLLLQKFLNWHDHPGS